MERSPTVAAIESIAVRPSTTTRLPAPGKPVDAAPDAPTVGYIITIRIIESRDVHTAVETIF
jgi:hypothetical protein